MTDDRIHALDAGIDHRKKFIDDPAWTSSEAQDLIDYTRELEKEKVNQKWYVYWVQGENAAHSLGLEELDTELDVVLFIEKLIGEDSGTSYTVIHGTKTQEKK